MATHLLSRSPAGGHTRRRWAAGLGTTFLHRRLAHNWVFLPAYRDAVRASRLGDDARSRHRPCRQPYRRAQT